MSHRIEPESADLARALQEARPVPEPEFTERLDQAVADHFPPEWADEAALGKDGKGGIGTLSERFRRWLAGNRTVIPALAGTVGVLFVVAVVATNVSDHPNGDSDSGSNAPTDMAKRTVGAASGGITTADSASSGVATEPPKNVVRAGVRLGPESYSSTDSAALNFYDLAMAKNLKSQMRGRDVAKEAEITLGTDPEGVQDVANEVVSVTDDHHGIVMKSNVTDGVAGKAGATFSLLVPAREIESAVADLSGIADLRSRSQELIDITAPTNRAEDDIADSKAKIKSLLGELETTYDEDDRANLERRIRWERNEKRWAENRLNRLERRADFTPVDLKVETGRDSVSDDGSSSWGLGDAFDDAGKLLGVAAGVTVLALAVAIPIGIVILIALALNRAWVRRSRRRVLADDE